MFSFYVCNTYTHIDAVSNCSAQNFVDSVQLAPQLRKLLLADCAMAFRFRFGGRRAQSVGRALIRILAHELLPPDFSSAMPLFIGIVRQLLR
ncbi:hypothetical protein, partial [Rhodococcus sp. EPR-279]